MKGYTVEIGFLVLVSCLFSGCGYFPRITLFMRDPLTAEEHNNLGVAYEREGKYELALKEYERAIHKDASLVIPLVNMGNVYFKLGEYKKAEGYYLRALKKDEKNIEAANNLASLYITIKKDYGKGLEYLTKALPSPDSAPAYALDTMGVLYLRLGDKPKAKETLIRACEKAGSDKTLLREIEAHLGELGEKGCPSWESKR